MQKIRFNESNPKLPELCRTVKQICEVLPTLDVKGDNKTVFVDEHINGKVIRAKPKGSSGVGSASEGGAATEYDGPWSFKLQKNVQGTQFLSIRHGYYIRNGCYVTLNWPFVNEDITNFGYETINLTSKIKTDGVYYVHIYQSWVAHSKAWTRPEIRITQDEPPRGIAQTATDIYGYCLLGWLRRTTVDEVTTFDYECYELRLPIMFVSGECRTGEMQA